MRRRPTFNFFPSSGAALQLLAPLRRGHRLRARAQGQNRSRYKRGGQSSPRRFLISATSASERPARPASARAPVCVPAALFINPQPESSKVRDGAQGLWAPVVDFGRLRYRDPVTATACVARKASRTLPGKSAQIEHPDDRDDQNERDAHGDARRAPLGSAFAEEHHDYQPQVIIYRNGGVWTPTTSQTRPGCCSELSSAAPKTITLPMNPAVKGTPGGSEGRARA